MEDDIYPSSTLKSQLINNLSNRDLDRYKLRFDGYLWNRPSPFHDILELDAMLFKLVKESTIM